MNAAQIPLDFSRAMEARDVGIQRSADHANRVESEWTGQALGMLRAYAAQIRRPFLIEEAREWAVGQKLPPPPDERAWGAVVKRAAHRQKAFIQRTGMTARAASSNCSDKPLWVYCVAEVKHV